MGEVISWTIEEPIENGVFKTSLEIARSGEILAFSCNLEAGNPGQVVAPVFFDVHCPRVVRDVIHMEVDWVVGSSLVSTTLRRFRFAQGGQELASLIIDETRDIPLIVVSEHEGFLLHPDVADSMARDLAGLAVVATLNDSASWELTHRLDVDWSCYNGAIRIYWPFKATAKHPFRHPLWTAHRLMNGGLSTQEAANRIRGQFRRKILGLSTLTVYRHSVFDKVVQVHQNEVLEAKRKEALEQQDFNELFNLATEENSELLEKNKVLREKVDRLKSDLANTQTMLDFANTEAEIEISPDLEVPPGTVEEAVNPIQ